MFPCIMKDSFVSIMIDNVPHNIDKSHPNFGAIVHAIREERENDVRELIDITKTIDNFGHGEILVVDGVVTYKGYELHNSLTDRIIRMVGEGFNVNPMLKFLENLLNNPSNTAINELYGFLEKGDLPITEDGCFLAYKKVRWDYTDIRTGNFDNSVGQLLEMPRSMVDDNRNNTCSQGFHFCSIEYLPSFGSGSRSNDKVVIVKINPADVVSIPSDYNDTKGRTCKYKVVAEHKLPETEPAFNLSVSDLDFNTLDYLEDGEPNNGNLESFDNSDDDSNDDDDLPF